MPIFEYVCAACGHEYEDLIFGDERAACPRCASKKAERKLSVFSARGAARPDPNPPRGGGSCGTCGDPRGPGACAQD